MAAGAPFKVETPVLVRDYRPAHAWITGRILNKRSSAMYDVLVGQDTWTRHQNQLRTPTAHRKLQTLHFEGVKSMTNHVAKLFRLFKLVCIFEGSTKENEIDLWWRQLFNGKFKFNSHQTFPEKCTTFEGMFTKRILWRHINRLLREFSNPSKVGVLYQKPVTKDVCVCLNSTPKKTDSSLKQSITVVSVELVKLRFRVAFTTVAGNKPYVRVALTENLHTWADHPFFNCIVADSPEPAYMSYGSVMTVVEDLKKLRFPCLQLASHSHTTKEPLLQPASPETEICRCNDGPHRHTQSAAKTATIHLLHLTVPSHPLVTKVWHHLRPKSLECADHVIHWGFEKNVFRIELAQGNAKNRVAGEKPLIVKHLDAIKHPVNNRSLTD
ncbi:hypothetical protein CLF_111053 [Clonorchis sinensis]|uniref:Uncharacterized protein n=1 Tax=Clonorchis sinensis TaxID=79923 RepID=G7YLD8_CLOSI|nr:hypothetical protein CLF_111053 [Clonorchis sinensis]